MLYSLCKSIITHTLLRLLKFCVVAHGELSGMEDGVPGMEKGTAQPVEEEATQDEDILTFEEFKQRRMMEVQLHQQEELKNSGKCMCNYCALY